MTEAEVVTYLASQGGGTAGVDIWYGSMLETYPDVVTLVQVTGGLPDEPDMGDEAASGSKTRLEFPRLQILYRGIRDDYTGPRTRAESGRVAMMKIVNTTLSGVRYLSAEPLGPPYKIRQDENFRYEFAIKVQVTKELS
jgi:hypothetical protein